MARQLADDIFRFSWIRISVFWLTFYWHSFILEQFMMTSYNENIFALLAFVRGIHRPPVNSHLNGQGRVAVMFSLTCAWINGWVNNRNKDGDLRRYRAHYEVTGMCRGAKHASNHHRNQYWSLMFYYTIGLTSTSHYLTHWGRVTHICVSEIIIIGSDNGLSPGRHQAII